MPFVGQRRGCAETACLLGNPHQNSGRRPVSPCLGIGVQLCHQMVGSQATAFHTQSLPSGGIGVLLPRNVLGASTHRDSSPQKGLTRAGVSRARAMSSTKAPSPASPAGLGPHRPALHDLGILDDLYLGCIWSRSGPCSIMFCLYINDPPHQLHGRL